MREKLCLESERECHTCARTDTHTCEVSAIILWKKELAMSINEKQVLVLLGVGCS